MSARTIVITLTEAQYGALSVAVQGYDIMLDDDGYTAKRAVLKRAWMEIQEKWGAAKKGVTQT